MIMALIEVADPATPWQIWFAFYRGMSKNTKKYTPYFVRTHCSFMGLHSGSTGGLKIVPRHSAVHCAPRPEMPGSATGYNIILLCWDLNLYSKF